MDRGGVDYYRVQKELRQTVENYFTYVINDRSVPEREREGLIARDARVFLALAHIYRDAPTIDYLDSLLTMETIMLSRREQSGDNGNNGPFRKYADTHQQSAKAKSRAQSARSLSDLCRELCIDESMLADVITRAGVSVTIEEVQGQQIQSVDEQAYMSIKTYLKKLRP